MNLSRRKIESNVSVFSVKGIPRCDHLNFSFPDFDMKNQFFSRHFHNCSGIPNQKKHSQRHFYHRDSLYHKIPPANENSWTKKNRSSQFPDNRSLLPPLSTKHGVKKTSSLHPHPRHQSRSEINKTQREQCRRSLFS